MNASDMLDYALGQLEGDAAEQAARELDADPELADGLERLTLSVGRLLDDRDSLEPPLGLATRTIAFVEAESKLRRSNVLEFNPSRPRFRREDLAVAATIFLASLLALAPAILRGRERWGRAACQNNLQKVGMRLHQYAAINHDTTIDQAYPFVSTDEEVPLVGSIICRLNDAGFRIEPRDLHCPCSGSDSGKIDRIPRLSEVAQTMKLSHDEGCRLIGQNDYAFHVGSYPSPMDYADPKGKARPLTIRASHTIPLVADRPAFHAGEILEGNSPNHAGQGQNVLFADGHSAWHNTRKVTPVDNDLYLNHFNRPAYGVTPEDAVLMPAVFRVQAH